MDGQFLATIKSKCDQIVTGRSEGQRAANRRCARGTLRAGEQTEADYQVKADCGRRAMW
jgi:hypothetical protein